jgi:hypothetical protein
VRLLLTQPNFSMTIKKWSRGYWQSSFYSCSPDFCILPLKPCSGRMANARGRQKLPCTQDGELCKAVVPCASLIVFGQAADHTRNHVGCSNCYSTQSSLRLEDLWITIPQMVCVELGFLQHYGLCRLNKYSLHRLERCDPAITAHGSLDLKQETQTQIQSLER